MNHNQARRDGSAYGEGRHCLSWGDRGNWNRSSSLSGLVNGESPMTIPLVEK
jgi:hypothetical protein